MKNLFNKTFMFAGLFGLLILAACSDDDGAEVSPVVGTWNYESATLDISVNGTPLLDFFTALFQAAGLSDEEAAAQAQTNAEQFETGANIFVGFEIVFAQDGTYDVSFADGDTSAGTWAANSDNSVVTLTDADGEDIVFTVATLTSTAASFTFTQVEEGSDLDQDGTNDTISIDFTMNLTKAQ